MNVECSLEPKHGELNLYLRGKASIIHDQQGTVHRRLRNMVVHGKEISTKGIDTLVAAIW